MTLALHTITMEHGRCSDTSHQLQAGCLTGAGYIGHVIIKCVCVCVCVCVCARECVGSGYRCPEAKLDTRGCNSNPSFPAYQKPEFLAAA
eukprot:1158467-Pelagomonas_calceolata.AAC.10